MTKISLWVFVAVVFSAGIAGTKLFSIQKQRELDALEQSPDHNKISWHVKKAKLKGEKQVTLSPFRVDYPGGGSDLPEALSYFSVAVVQPVASVTGTVNDYSVTTWYKLKILEYLSKRDTPCITCPTLEQVPQSLLPINQDEVVLNMAGGSYLIDGVNVITPSNHLPLEKSKQYLLLLSTTSSGTALIGAGPAGAFLIDENHKLQAVGDSSHRIQHDMSSKFDSDEFVLRQSLNASH
jgi:hypothetical protein